MFGTTMQQGGSPMVMVPLFEDEVVDLPWPKPQLRVLQGGLAGAALPFEFADDAEPALAVPTAPVLEPRRVTRSSAAVSPRVRRNRRVLLGVALLATALAVVVPAAGAFARPLAPGQASALAPGLALRGTYVVAPGDTVATIAARFAPAGELAATEAALLREAGSAVLVPGEHLAIP